MSNGKVNKTIVAASVATALIERGHRVRLSTTDPAAHVEAESLSTVSRIDLVIAVVMQSAGASWLLWFSEE